jgi:hypothetical protein
MSGFINDPLELPTQQLKDDAFNLLGETSEKRKESIIQLRDLINKLPIEDQIDNKDDDIILIAYLRGKKFNIEKALETTISYAKFHIKHSDICQSIEENKDEFINIFSNFCYISKDKDKFGRVVVVFSAPNIFKKINANPSFLDNNPCSLARFNIWLFNKLKFNIDIQVYGMCLVGYFTGLTFWETTLLPKIAPLNERKQIFKYVTNCCSFRFKGAYIFDEPFYLRWIFNIIYPFLSAKMASRFHLCSHDYSRLDEIIEDKKNLPIQLGGTYKIENFDWVKNNM